MVSISSRIGGIVTPLLLLLVSLYNTLYCKSELTLLLCCVVLCVCLTAGRSESGFADAGDGFSGTVGWWTQSLSP